LSQAIRDVVHAIRNALEDAVTIGDEGGPCHPCRTSSE
jgi:hypothetical protein